MTIPVLTTQRLVLRAVQPSDWDEFSAMNADPAGRQWLGGNLLNRDQSWDQMAFYLGHWTLRGYGMFVVETAGSFAGRVGLFHPSDWPEPELAWSLSARFWGQGFATEAAAEVRRWAFVNLQRDRFVSYIMPGNIRSQRVAKKLGAVADGQIILRGVLSDVWVHPGPNQGVVA